MWDRPQLVAQGNQQEGDTSQELQSIRGMGLQVLNGVWPQLAAHQQVLMAEEDGSQELQRIRRVGLQVLNSVWCVVLNSASDRPQLLVAQGDQQVLLAEEDRSQELQRNWGVGLEVLCSMVGFQQSKLDLK